jgi:hypothetical protein
MSGYHPDKMMGTALGYAVASRGSDFNDVYSAMENIWLPDMFFGKDYNAGKEPSKSAEWM